MPLMNRGITKIGLTALLAVLVVVATTAFIFGTTRKNKTAQNTPTPTQIQNYTPLPTNEITPLITLTTTAIPNPTPSPNPSSKPLISGIKGVATLKSCESGSCTINPVAQMKIDVKTTSGSLINTVYTDSSGKFSINLDPGEYTVGPFREPASSAMVAAAKIRVNKGYFSEVNIRFESNL